MKGKDVGGFIKYLIDKYNLHPLMWAHVDINLYKNAEYFDRACTEISIEEPLWFMDKYSRAGIVIPIKKLESNIVVFERFPFGEKDIIVTSVIPTLAMTGALNGNLTKYGRALIEGCIAKKPIRTEYGAARVTKSDSIKIDSVTKTLVELGFMCIED
jgi:hypothetical protein